jgi:hypothetical protein
MALALGTNSGFVTVAPTADPAGGGTTTIDAIARVLRHTSPSTAAKITEIGWWCNEATEEANFEVGLYAADGGVVPGEAGTLLFVSATNAKGTTGGVWKTVTVDWTISPSTVYWIGVQLDNTATSTTMDVASVGGDGYDSKTSQTTLTDPFGGGAIVDTDGMLSIYALWATSGPANLKSYNTNLKTNIKSINTNLITNVKSLDTNV